jgi:hypothetical protein
LPYIIDVKKRKSTTFPVIDRMTGAHVTMPFPKHLTPSTLTLGHQFNRFSRRLLQHKDRFDGHAKFVSTGRSK